MTIGSLYGDLAASGSIIAASPWATWNGSLDGSTAIFRQDLVLGTCVTPLSSSSVIVTWEDAALNDDIWACVGTISGTTITWGTPVTVSGAAVTGSLPQVVALSSTSAMIAYADTTNNGIKAVVLSISGTTITVNTIVSVTSNAIDTLSLTKLSSTAALLVFDGSTDKGKAVVLSVSGTTITSNTAFQFNGSSNTAPQCVVSAISSTQALVVYSDSGNSSFSTAQVLNISGTTVSGNTKYVFNSTASSIFQICAVSSTTFGLVYHNSADSGFTATQVLSVAGTVVTFGSAVRVINLVMQMGYAAITAADSQSLFIFYRNVTNSLGIGVVGTISGTAITLDTPVTVKSTVCSEMSVCAIGPTHTLYTFRDNGNSSKGTGKVSRAI